MAAAYNLVPNDTLRTEAFANPAHRSARHAYRRSTVCHAFPLSFSVAPEFASSDHKAVVSDSISMGACACPVQKPAERVQVHLRMNVQTATTGRSLRLDMLAWRSAKQVNTSEKESARGAKKNARAAPALIPAQHVRMEEVSVRMVGVLRLVRQGISATTRYACLAQKTVLSVDPKEDAVFAFQIRFLFAMDHADKLVSKEAITTMAHAGIVLRTVNNARTLNYVAYARRTGIFKTRAASSNAHQKAMLVMERVKDANRSVAHASVKSSVRAVKLAICCTWADASKVARMAIGQTIKAVFHATHIVFSASQRLPALGVLIC